MDFTAEQQEIIQKCHDNELPRTYAEELYNKLLALLPPKTEAEQEAELITLYNEKVNDKIRAKYSISQEFAMPPTATQSQKNSMNIMLIVNNVKQKQNLN